MITISVLLGIEFITYPDASWFNPFTMETAIIFTDVVWVLLQLIVRMISKIS
ncbi:hypothetical protein SAMN05421734_103306 [Pelagirhabdus alkalitolerans]|uniref:Uncharacterized protein n=1 Tax=Pelagirhabdus alkalitolerans TaxID=1612202 RepID=A0A1G6HZV8_9BACI|nr:hypothetical protein [Pelagirhabdus alkalitolerans]SDB99827.1 hypothetical protein SAMN05421734_103306 [Pelagirhabdus alkalitolerans]